jgi:hypothetical protein
VYAGSPSDYASFRTNIPAAEVLLKYGADPPSSLHIAITWKQASVVKLLLEASAKDPESLGIAVTENFLEVAELCLKYGGDPADGESYDKELSDDLGPAYDGMTIKMRKLLDEWK